jgi:hypothetical protein
MREMVIFLGCSAVAIVLAGCASPPPVNPADEAIDHVYVAQVEAAARHTGANVMWVNYPRKATVRP